MLDYSMLAAAASEATNAIQTYGTAITAIGVTTWAGWKGVAIARAILGKRGIRFKKGDTEIDIGGEDVPAEAVEWKNCPQCAPLQKALATTQADVKGLLEVSSRTAGQVDLLVKHFIPDATTPPKTPAIQT